ncbi:endothelial cell-specific chemotaxis regulator isoform X3 [Eptesicus fuscus]|uniref:endothelial cell-specific chemotaxis regulator isoform X3 n=1 Tax=Eptesicus fuscus TaxID=29078 RepID=UPI002404244E|nr:endothelial cell-specific chemotaxis regulator isoform X3 [Eptesicus fuscus]
MGTAGTTQLCRVILSFLLLQGHNSQPTTMHPSSRQGAISLSLTIQPTSPNTAAPENASQVPTVPSKPVMPRSSTMDGHSPSQPQEHTPGFDTSQNVTSKLATTSPRTREDPTILPSPMSEQVLTVAAFGVISFIVILVVVVIILVSVVSLRFKCQKNKESEDPQKPGSSGISESCSTANGEKDRITLISMKNINMNNSKGCRSAEKVL